MELEDLDELTDDNFNNKEKGMKYILYFTASWCGPCKQIYPFLCDINKKSDNINIYKIDVDNNDFLTGKFKILSMPTFIFIKNKQHVDTLVGSDTTKLTNHIIKNFKN